MYLPIIIWVVGNYNKSIMATACYCLLHKVILKEDRASVGRVYDPPLNTLGQINDHTPPLIKISLGHFIINFDFYLNVRKIIHILNI